MAAIPLTRTHRVLIGIVVAGAVVIAAIGFAGSYAAVRELAEAKGFGQFSLVFPIGIDAGICVLLALDLLLRLVRCRAGGRSPGSSPSSARPGRRRGPRHCGSVPDD
ncbi:hypothetical protein SMICM17S_11742 [Streptomyces microflavus]